jgi:hypothetical protein
MSFIVGLESFLPNEIGEKEFAKLDFEVNKLEEMLRPLVLELEQKKSKRDILAIVFNPHIIISEVNTPSMGHSYLGKIRIPANSIYNTEDKPKFLNFSLGKVSIYTGKDDPKLLLLAREKAKDVVRRKIFKLF